jgi:thioredoxin 1
MMFFNQYSFILAAALAFLALAWALLRDGAKGSDLAALGALLLGLVLAYSIFRPGAGSPAPAIESQIGQGTPVLLEFQSEYCLGCMAAKPIVDGIERDYAGRLKVIRINLQQVGAQLLAAKYGCRYTPTFFFFNAQGQQLWRTIGAIDPAEVGRSLEGS